MKKKILLTLLLAGVAAGIYFSVKYIYGKAETQAVTYKTTTPQIGSVLRKTVATGNIEPREEVAFKPPISGLVEELYVAPGDTVQKGDKVALIRIIPNIASLNNAENRVQTAKLNLEQAQKQEGRYKQLFEQKMVSAEQYQQIKLSLELALTELDAAKSNLEIVREGASNRPGQKANMLKANVAGMVLEVPVKPGTSVIAANSFNEGTTIASVANMSDIIFRGNVDESEVGKLHPGMALDVQVGALEDVVFTGRLEHISPKGAVVEGTIQFEIKASVTQRNDYFLRAGYSASANIILERADSVITISESLLGFEKNKKFVEVLTQHNPQTFEKKYITTGLSDGLIVEVTNGLTLSDKIKIRAEYGKEKRGRKPKS